MRTILEGLTVDRSRTVLMAQSAEHDRVRGEEQSWDVEPVYGTQYRVERYDEALIEEVRAAGQCLHPSLTSLLG